MINPRIIHPSHPAAFQRSRTAITSHSTRMRIVRRPTDHNDEGRRERKEMTARKEASIHSTTVLSTWHWQTRKSRRIEKSPMSRKLLTPTRHRAHQSNGYEVSEGEGRSWTSAIPIFVAPRRVGSQCRINMYTDLEASELAIKRERKSPGSWMRRSRVIEAKASPSHKLSATQAEWMAVERTKKKRRRKVRSLTGNL